MRPDAHARRARIAISALFLANGALFANILPRYPEIKQNLGLDSVEYGVAVAAFPAGAIVAGLASAALIRRLSSARVAVIGTVLTSLGLFAAGNAPSGVLFAAALFVSGACDAVTDVAENAHGLRVQRRYGRSVINSFHAIWSVGAVLGGAMAAGAIALGIPVGVHLGISTAVFALVAILSYRLCLPGPDDDHRRDEATNPATGENDSHPRRRLLTPRLVATLAALTLIAMAGAVAEDAGNSWATLYLGHSLGAASAVAPLGFIALVGAQCLGRFLGDATVDRFGERVVARVGGIIAAVGMGLALAFPSVAGTILGFAATGFGIATLIPAAMHAADQVPGLRPGMGLTIVSWLLRLGFLLSPPFVGFVAETVSLRAGLVVAPASGIVAVLLAGALAPRLARRTGAPSREPLDGL